MNFTKVVLFTLLLFLSGCAQHNTEKTFDNADNASDDLSKNQVLYTFSGTKDPALSAEFILTYIATSTDEHCVKKQGTMSVPITKVEKFIIKKESYIQRIYINVTPLKDDICAFKFTSLNLNIKKTSIPDVYNRFPILGSYPSFIQGKTGNWAHPIYNGNKYDAGTLLPIWRQTYSIPSSYRSNKYYFRIADITQFKCITSGSKNAKSPHFLCLMDIEDEAYRYKPCDAQTLKSNEECNTLYHPEFEIDALQNSKITLDILTDKSTK